MDMKRMTITINVNINTTCINARVNQRTQLYLESPFYINSCHKVLYSNLVNTPQTSSSSVSDLMGGTNLRT
jgi:hypothetical protein